MSLGVSPLTCPDIDNLKLLEIVYHFVEQLGTDGNWDSHQARSDAVADFLDNPPEWLGSRDQFNLGLIRGVEMVLDALSCWCGNGLAS